MSKLKIDADDYMEWVNGLLPHEHELVLLRSLNALGWEYTMVPDGIDFDGEEDDSELQAALHKQYVLLFSKHIMEYYVQEGKVEPVCVYDDGQIGYSKVTT